MTDPDCKPDPDCKGPDKGPVSTAGHVVQVGVTRIDALPYDVIYITVERFPTPPPGPCQPVHRPVFYLEPDRPFAAACAGAALLAQARGTLVDVYCDPHDPRNGRICAVVPRDDPDA